MRRALKVAAVLAAFGAGGFAAWWLLRADTGAPVGATARALCDGLRRVDVGDVRVPELTELSGLAASRATPGLLWAHNDSGDRPVLYALRDDGRGRGTVDVPGAEAVDWEDLAVGPGPGPGATDDVLYVADIGDNDAVRDDVAVYRVPEPRPAGEGFTVPGAVDRIALRYPDGAHDAETLLADPRTGDVFVVTKHPRGRSRVYRAAAPLAAGEPVTLEHVATLDLGGGGLATGGDITPSGDAIAVRTYFSVFVWGRREGESVAAALDRPPCRAPRVAERQGEALAFDAAGTGYFTTGESVRPPLHHWRP